MDPPAVDSANKAMSCHSRLYRRNFYRAKWIPLTSSWACKAGSTITDWIPLRAHMSCDTVRRELLLLPTLCACALPRQGGLRALTIPVAMLAEALCSWQVQSSWTGPWGRGQVEVCILVLQARGFSSGLTTWNCKKLSCHRNSNDCCPIHQKAREVVMMMMILPLW